jgi:hypothetical protein
MDDNELSDLRYRYDALTAEVQARESSTLAIATFTAAASLAFLAIVAQGDIRDARVYFLGLLFVLCGLLYRELTVFTIDRKQLAWIREIEERLRNSGRGLFPESTRWDNFYTNLRRFVFRCVVWLPVVFLLRYLARLDLYDYWIVGPVLRYLADLHYLTFGILVGPWVPLLITVFEWLVSEKWRLEASPAW